MNKWRMHKFFKERAEKKHSIGATKDLEVEGLSDVSDDNIEISNG